VRSKVVVTFYSSLPHLSMVRTSKWVAFGDCFHFNQTHSTKRSGKSSALQIPAICERLIMYRRVGLKIRERTPLGKCQSGCCVFELSVFLGAKSATSPLSIKGGSARLPSGRDPFPRLGSGSRERDVLGMTRPSRSSASGSIDNSPGGIFLHG
jgi:hypothetical protein